MNGYSDSVKKMGIYAASRLSSKIPGVIFRAQRDGGTGLNAHIEITLEGLNRTERIIGLRICSSFETEKTARGYVCSGEAETAAYWLQHSLPVVIMVYENEENIINKNSQDKILWEAVTPENLEISGNKWEVIVPYDQFYDENSIEKIANLNCTSPHLAKLAIDKAWIELIATDREIFIEMDEWINQPSSRGNLRLIVNSPNISESGIYQWPFNVSPDMPHIMKLPELFPWAALYVDENFYKERNSEVPQENILAPYVIEAGEIARFRLRMTLNVLGHAFLAAEPFICKGIFPEMKNLSGFGSEYEAGLKYQLFKK